MPESWSRPWPNRSPTTTAAGFIRPSRCRQPCSERSNIKNSSPWRAAKPPYFPSVQNEKKCPKNGVQSTPQTPEPERKSEEPVYEKISDKNFEQYRQQKEVTFDGKTWKISSITPDGRISLHRDITTEEAVSLAERAKKGEVRGVVDTPSVKTRARLVSRGELESGGQWIVEKPPRSPQNPERQKEVDAVRTLQARLTSKEFAGGKLGEEDLLMDVFERTAQRLNQESQDYERSVGKK